MATHAFRQTARPSTSQVEALKAAGCEKIFREKVSGARADRPELQCLLAAIDSGDCLLVTRLDRLARSTRDLLNILDTLATRGAGFRSLRDHWADTTTPHGRLMLTVLGGLAEFERDLIRARTGDGRTRAKARGVHMGRPSILTAHQRHEAAQALRNGTATQADLARQFNVSQSTISRLAEKVSSLAARQTGDRRRHRPSGAGFPASARRPLSGTRSHPVWQPRTADPSAPRATPILLSFSMASTATGRRRKDIAGIAFRCFDGNRRDGPSSCPCGRRNLPWPETFSNPALIDNIAARRAFACDRAFVIDLYEEGGKRVGRGADFVEGRSIPTAHATEPTTRCSTPAHAGFVRPRRRSARRPIKTHHVLSPSSDSILFSAITLPPTWRGSQHRRRHFGRSPITAGITSAATMRHGRWCAPRSCSRRSRRNFRYERRYPSPHRPDPKHGAVLCAGRAARLVRLHPACEGMGTPK